MEKSAFSFRNGRLIAWSVALVALSILMGSRSANAVGQFTPFASVDQQDNTNVFGRASDGPPLAAVGDDRFGDTISSYSAGFASGLSGPTLQANLNAQIGRQHFSHFGFLDNTFYRLEGGFGWRATEVIEWNASYIQVRSMAPLTDSLLTALFLDTDRALQGTLKILVRPEWRLDLTPTEHWRDTPLPGFEGFSLHETEGSATLNYLGFSKLTAGLRVDYLSGRFEGIVNPTRYTQVAEGLTANYQVSGLSSFTGQLGYTRRTSELYGPASGAGSTIGSLGGAVGTTSSVTGSLGYHRAITGKTSLTLQVFREIDSYVAGANPQVGIGGLVNLTWKPDVKFNVELGYSQRNEDAQGNVVLINATNYKQNIRSELLDVTYNMTDWLHLKAYVHRLQQASNIAIANYTSNLYGLTLTAQPVR
jgi:hypothetical protein